MKDEKVTFNHEKEVTTASYRLKSGKVIKACSRCATTDVYDEQVGETIARVRCEERIASARERYMFKRLTEDNKAVHEAIKQYKKDFTLWNRYNNELHEREKKRKEIEKQYME